MSVTRVGAEERLAAPMVAALDKRLYQCPGCWSYGCYPRPPEGAWRECDCGERMTLIDLRERREQPLNEDAH